MTLTGKAALVTGAGQGIGRACALALAEAGARVAVVDLKQDAAEATLALLPEPSRHIALTANVADSAAVKAAFAQAEAALGRLDILVNNAGTGTGPNDGSAKMYELMAARNAEIARGETPTTHVEQAIYMEDEGWRAVMAVNLDGAFYCTREALRVMARHNIQGSVINIASTAVQSGEGPLHYVTSKAALIGMTRALARECASRGIRVNAVAPGPTDTPLMRSIPDEWISSLEKAIPLGRLARPAEVAAAVRFLASDEASYVTGSVLVANGGSYFF
ncbi:MAG: SDR family NAD(P)-dependent oxidoreductase [Steroidobacteraceae bacterium]|jgi:3-oxoacyl-[acyl-carrier protein] reductase